jgi:hypothetical protein
MPLRANALLVNGARDSARAVRPLPAPVAAQTKVSVAPGASQGGSVGAS